MINKPFPINSRFLKPLQQMTFENIVAKWVIAQNERYFSLSHYVTQMTFDTCWLLQTTYENIAIKGEIAQNEQFHLLLQYFELFININLSVKLVKSFV